MSSDKLLAEKDGAIGWIIFNNPAKHNAVSKDMWDGLADAVDRFNADDGVRVIVLKGAHLGNLVYGSPALRTMGDLDLMVRRDQLSVAERLLARLGYTPLYEPLKQMDFTNHHHTRPLSRPGGIRIDVHWNIERPTAPVQADLDGIWHRAVAARIAGVDVLVLSPEDLVTDQNFIGAGYGLATPECLQAIHLVAETEGILLDDVYTAKAMAALIHHARQGQLDPDASVLFVHTGGVPALFAHASLFTDRS